MHKLNILVEAMKRHEGWFSVGTPGYPNGSRSYRHHNPLNLRASPYATRLVDNFAVFETDQKGFDAAVWDITQKALGNTRTKLTGESTLADLIRIWAPAEDQNDPNSYLQSIVEQTGFSATMRLKELLTA